MLQLKSAYRDGTTHIVISALEFMRRLAALVARPRLHLIRFHGVLSPHAKRRTAIAQGTGEKPSDHAEQHTHAPASGRTDLCEIRSLCPACLLMQPGVRSRQIDGTPPPTRRKSIWHKSRFRLPRS